MTATKTILRNLSLFTFILTTAVTSAAELVEINVYPENIDLSNSRDRQRVIVQARFADGITEDVTEQATLTAVNAEVLRKEGYTFYPKTDGETTVNVEYQGKAIQIPAKVQNAEVIPPISYTLDVMPIFLKTNCNTGSCHGAARGKDGFRLSLYGFDVNGDYTRITRDFSSRRINLAFPEDSLLLTKGAGVVPHTGGTRFRKGDELYETVHEWLRSGALLDQGEIPTVTKVDIYPKGAVLNGEGAQQKISVRAYYSDGTDRDVTHLAYFSSNNDNSAVIEQDGVVTAQNRGEAFIMARFDTHTVGTHFIVLPKNLQFAWNELPENNYVDSHMHNKFKNLRIIPSELCTDEEFIRRVTLDLSLIHI